MNRNRLAGRVRALRTTSAYIVLAAAMGSFPAYAQTGATNNATSDPTASAGVQSASSAQDEGTIVVTGTLITNPNLVRSAPVNVTTSEEVELRQSNVAEQLLREVPGVVPSIGNAVNNGQGGSSFVNLRGLGSNRNLVLLDGNRIVPAGLTGRVDLNNIPLSLVERTEVLTGGASTTYGADAVSGVVNFITKRDFAGLEMQSSEQITEHGDGNVFRTDVTVGANFDDDRGNAVFSIGYQEADPVYQGDRDFSHDQFDSFTGHVSGSSWSVPSTFTGTRPLGADGQPNTTPAFTITGYKPDGTPIIAAVAAGANNRTGSGQINPTTGVVGPIFNRFNFNPYNLFQTPFTRFNMFGEAHYKIADGLEVYTRGLFSKNRVEAVLAPSGAFGPAVNINLNNPYLPVALRNQLCAFNIAPATTGVDAKGNSVLAQTSYAPRLSPADCALAAASTGTTFVNTAGQTVSNEVSTNVFRRATEVGPRHLNFQTTVFDYRLGFRGDITDRIHYDVSGGYGESENDSTLTNYVLTSRLRQAAVAVRGPNGSIVCVDQSNSCVPVNLFGAEGSITPSQASFLSAASTTAVRTSLAQARAVVNGDLGVSLPWANDAINFAVGGEYRRYTAEQRPDILAQTPGELGGNGASKPVVQGAFDVYEAFGELVAPIVQDRPLFRSLTLETGIRYSHYTVDAPSRPKFNTTTWKAQGTWEPVSGVKLRGGYSRAVRAPNISELFAPAVTGLTTLATDPCAGSAPVSNANLRAICLAQGAPSGAIGTIANPTSSQANITAGGNLNLKPEKSNSYTIGAVLQPDLIPGFAISVDYYNIKISGAITAPTPGDILAACFGNITSASAASTACTSIRRDPVTGGLNGDPATTPGLPGVLSNAGTLATDGIDLTVNYNTDLGFAKLALSFAGNWTDHARFKALAASATSVNRDCVGFYSGNCGAAGTLDTGSIQPDFSWSQRTTLSFDKVDLSVLWRHISAVKQEPLSIAEGDADPAYVGPVVNSLGQSFGNQNFGFIPAYDYFDLAARFGVSDNMTFTLTVNNLFNRKPPLVGGTVGTSTFDSGNTYPSTYDALGRTYAVGLRLKF